MKLDQKLVIVILDTARQMGIDGQTWTWVKHQDFPGAYSSEEISFHLEHCKKRGFIELKKTLSAATGVLLTPMGSEYLSNSEER